MTTVQAVGAVSRDAAEWHAINWQAINRNVRRLQVRIVQATKASRWGKVQALQRLLTHSYSGKVLAVRRVTENNGKKTPGVDKEIWNTPEKKIQAVHALKRRGYQPQPLRRVYIPKSDGKTMRPLGIPTMTDRAQQALHLLALDPVLETNADNNSYGFRQQRSCADAIEQCFNTLSKPNPQWILEGDIKSCFDRGGYPLDSPEPYRLWFAFSLTRMRMNDLVSRDGVNVHRLLYQTKEELAATL